MEKLVFFDIDGTLLYDYDKVPKSTVLALEELHKNGHKAFICTGRATGFVVDPAILSLPWDGIVAACGCHVEINKEIVYEYIMSEQFIKKTLKICKDHGFRPIMEGPKSLYLNYEDFPMEDPYGMRLRRSLKDIPAIDGTEADWVVNKFSIATEGEEEVRQDGYRQFGPDFDILIHSKDVAELVPKGHSKGTGILKVCEVLKIPVSETIAIGDSANDIEMLKTAGIGICMGNGTKEAKAVSDYITTDILDDGVYNALKHFELI